MLKSKYQDDYLRDPASSFKNKIESIETETWAKCGNRWGKSEDFVTGSIQMGLRVGTEQCQALDIDLTTYRSTVKLARRQMDQVKSTSEQHYFQCLGMNNRIAKWDCSEYVCRTMKIYLFV